MDEKYYEGSAFENKIYENEVFEEYKFIDCTFIECLLDNCNFINCAFTDCKFIKCRIINPKTDYSKIKYAEFIECSLTGIDWSDLKSNNLLSEPISIIKNCRLKYNTFTGIVFKKFDFSNSEIISCMFADCELKENNFKNCKLTDTEFFKCNISKSDFRGATGYNIDIMTNRMKGAKFSYPEVLSLLNILEINID